MAIRLRHCLILVLSLSVLSGCAATPQIQPYQPVVITEIVEIPDQTQEQIYNKARQWFSQYFVSGKSVVDYEDKNEGVIIGNGVSDNGSTDLIGLINYKLSFEYNIRLDTKDGKFRAMTTITKHQYTDTEGTHDSPNNVSPQRIESSKERIHILVNQLKEYIQKDNLQTEAW